MDASRAFKIIFFVLIFSPFRLFAQDQQDVGLITEISGKVFYSSGDAKSSVSEAMVFMKLRNNDRLKISEKSSLAVLYQANGLREVWTGPIEIKIGEEGSTVTEGQARSSKSETLPVTVSDKVFMASELDRAGAISKSGIRVVRSASETPESRLKQGLERYGKMKADYGEKDITPDLYLISLYLELGKKQDMERQISEMKKKWPGNPLVDRLVNSLNGK